MDMERNDEDLRANLDVTMERREVAATRHEHYKKQTESYYNQWVKGKCFKIGQKVLKNNEASRQEPHRKLRPIWEGS